MASNTFYYADRGPRMGKLRSIVQVIDTVPNRVYSFADGMKDGFITDPITVDAEDTVIMLKGAIPFILYRNERYRTDTHVEITGYIQIFYSSNSSNWNDVGIQEFKCVNHMLYDIHSFNVVLPNIPAGNIRFKYVFGVKKALNGTAIRPVNLCVNNVDFYPYGMVSGNNGFGDLTTSAPPSRLTPSMYSQFIVMQYDKNEDVNDANNGFTSVTRRISESVPGIDRFYGVNYLIPLGVR